MIELDVRLPLNRFELAVATRIDGRATAVLGPSGSGKTSLLQIIAGLRRAARGRLAIDGELMLDSAQRRYLPAERRRIGYVPQDSALFPHLDVEGNVRFGLRAADGSERLFGELVEMLEIGPLLNRHPRNLSGGERQRVALARALASSPRLLLLDEPLASLDVELKERIFPYLLRIRDAGQIPTLYVTHSLGEAGLFAFEVLLMREGRVVEQGAPGDVLGAGKLSILDSAASFDNLVDGVLETTNDGPDLMRLVTKAGFALTVPAFAGARPGARTTYSVPADDVLLSIAPLTGLSARNVFEGSVSGLDQLGFDVLVSVTGGGFDWRARLTARAVSELKLNPGRQVWVAIKSHSFRRLH